MRTIRISEEVWSAMAKIGKFGETPDDVLRQVFKIDNRSEQVARGKTRYATRRMSARIAANNLIVGFVDGPLKKWSLPSRNDKNAIRRLRDEAVEFVEENGATEGQINAVKKTLTDGGYHLIK